MTQLLDIAIDRLRELPDAMQDSAARAVLLQLEEECPAGDLETVDDEETAGETKASG